MSRKSLLAALAITLTLSLSLDDAWGQRGGRAGGGGGARGGYGGGASRSPSGTRGRSQGSMNRSPAAASGRNPGMENRGPGGPTNGGPLGGGFGGPGASGTRSGGAAGGLGGLSRDRFSSPSSRQLNGFLGLPTDQGLQNRGTNPLSTPGQPRSGENVDANYGTVEGARGGEAGGVAVTGPQGNTAGRAVGVGSQGGVATVGGVQGAEGASAVRGAAVGPNGNAAAGFAHVSPSGRTTTAAAVRTNYNHWDLYGGNWYRNNPGAWYAAGWATNTAWRASTWNTAAHYYGYQNTPPIYYDYGNNVIYQDNVVYVSGSEAGTSQQYYDQAASLATTGTQADAPADGDWLPLGVFALTRPDETQSTVTIQLAVNKEGVIRGNYTDTTTSSTQLIQGSVDKQTQRVAFTVGDDTTNLLETGLYNLTKEEAPCLVHFGSERTEQWLLVRLQNPQIETE
ncbi:MAG: protocadherin [Pirellulaceae bacterium]